MRFVFRSIVYIYLIVFSLSSCKSGGEHLNVYSGRHYQTDENLFREFTRQTGIRVNLVKADSDQLINRLELEGDNSPADILITADAGRMVMAKEYGLLQPMDFSGMEKLVPDHLRDTDYYWTGFTRRARVIVYDRDRVRPSELSNYEALTDDEWKGRVLIRSSLNHYNQTLMSSIIAHNGNVSTLEWARGIVANMAQDPRGNDRDQIKAIAAGVGDLAVVNTYYLGLLLHSTNPEERRIAGNMGVFFPNQDDRGTHINISGIGITAHSRNTGNALKLIRFLLNEEVQKVFAEETFEYPVNRNVEWSTLLREWGEFREDTLSLSELGRHLQQAMLIFNEAGWK